MSNALVEFLAAGPPPIIFTLGSTAVWVARDFFTQSIEAATQLGKRAVLLIGDERNRMPELPDHIFAADYAPYQSLLPHAVLWCTLEVPEQPPGTIGGRTNLIVPFAFDQFDNAAHARRMGTSRTVYRDRLSRSESRSRIRSFAEGQDLF